MNAVDTRFSDSIHNRSALQYKAVFEVAILALLTIALPIDAVTGFLAGGGASFQSLSLVYKALGISLILTYLVLFSPRYLGILLVFLLSLFGSVYIRVITTGVTDKAIIDVINIIKILTPLISIFFLVTVLRSNEERARFWIKAILFVSASTVLLNVLVGLLGYGYATYDFADAADVGSKGYFYAGNELSAVFVVISGFILTLTYSGRSRLYWVSGAGLLVCGLLLGTKSAVVAAFLLVMMIPLAYERGNLFKLTVRKVVIASLLIFALVVGYIALWNILEAFGLASRVDDVIERRGLLGFVFSGREIYLAQAVSNFDSSATASMVLFGVGQTGVDAFIGKGSIEIDVIDLFFWYGVAGLMYYMVLVTWLLKWSSKYFLQLDFPYVPGVFVTSIILVLQSATAGHVVVSGMLGIPWAALVCLALLRSRRG